MKKLRRLLHLPPRYQKERLKLSEAVQSGVLDRSSKINDVARRVETIVGWTLVDGPDWIEFELEAKVRKIRLETVGDLLDMLESIASEH